MIAEVLLVAALAIPPGGAATLDGAIQTSHDGSRFGAAEWFDLEAGGLRVVSHDGTRVRVAGTGEPAPGCYRLGLSSPCLVPKIAEHAHARLLGVEEFRGTLRGGIELTFHAPPPPPSPVPRIAALIGALAALAAALSLVAHARSTPLGRVNSAARAARRALGADPTLAVVRDEIERLVDHAREVDAVRRSCEGSLARVQRAPDRLAVEREEEDRLRADLSLARTRLGEIAAALRLVPLRVRAARDVRFAGPPPVDAILAELTLRDRALAEANA